MKTHFGFMENYGDYESEMWGCESVLCGYDTEDVCENATDDWDMVDCKKCLRLRERYEIGVASNEKHIVEQMGDMAYFFINQWQEQSNDL